MNKRYWFRRLAKEEKPWSVDEAMEDPEQLMEEMETESPGFGNEPSVSVQTGEIIFVKFTGEPAEKIRKDGKEIAYAELELLKDHEGWDGQTKKPVKVKKGAKAAMNLKRHAGLWRLMNERRPLTGRIFAIANMKQKIKTKKGTFACDYRVREFKTENLEA